MAEQTEYTFTLSGGTRFRFESDRPGIGAARELAEDARSMRELALLAMASREASAVNVEDIARALYVFAQWAEINAIAAQVEADHYRAHTRGVPA